MAGKMNVPVIGIIDNYAYIECPECKEKINLFGNNNTEEMAGKMGIPILGQLPLDPKLVEFCDQGQIDEYFLQKGSGIKEVISNVADAVRQ